MKNLDVLYSVNSKYLDMMLASLLSLIENGNIRNMRIHIITSEFMIEDYKKVENFIKDYHVDNLFFYSMDSFDIDKFGIPDWCGSQIANSLLFFDSIIGHNLKGVSSLLYLDADTLVVGNLNELSMFQDHVISAVKDTCPKNHLKLLKGVKNYFNSGVVLLNPNLWNKEAYEQKIIDFIFNHSDMKFSFPDQDILNGSLADSITELPGYFNVPPYAYLYGESFSKMYFNDKILNINYEEMCLARDNALILHTYGLLGAKPWIKNSINPLNQEFMDYIYRVNPEFKKEELPFVKRMILSNKDILFVFLMLRTLLPDNAVREIRNRASKILKK